MATEVIEYVRGNKALTGIKNIMIAPIVELKTNAFGEEVWDENTYGALQDLDDAVSFKATPKVASKDVYAKNKKYLSIKEVTQQDVELGIVHPTDWMKEKMFGYTKDEESGAYYLDASVKVKYFGIVVIASGTDEDEMIILPKVSLEAPEVSAKTKEESVDIQTVTLKGIADRVNIGDKLTSRFDASAKSELFKAIKKDGKLIIPNIGGDGTGTFTKTDAGSGEVAGE